MVATTITIITIVMNIVITTIVIIIITITSITIIIIVRIIIIFIITISCDIYRMVDLSDETRKDVAAAIVKGAKLSLVGTASEAIKI